MGDDGARFGFDLPRSAARHPVNVHGEREAINPKWPARTAIGDRRQGVHAPGRGELVEAFVSAPVPLAVVATTPSYRVGSANDSLAALLGCSREALAGRPMADFVVDGDLPLLESCFARLATGAECEELTMRWLRADGEQVVVAGRLRRSSDSLPPRSAVLVAEQLHRQREPGAGARNTQKMLTEVIDGVPALIFIKDLQNRYLLVNRRCAEIYGPIVGKTDDDVMTLEEAREFTKNDAEVIAAGEAREFEEWSLLDGELHTFYSLKFPLFDSEGRPYGLCGVASDITVVKKAEMAAREARDEAERADRAKSEFLSRVSHELRTPLHSILGYCQLLARDGAGTGAAIIAARMSGAGEHLLGLINDLLDVSRIEQGADGIAIEPVHACDPVSDAVDVVRPLATDRGLELVIDLHDGLHRFVAIDRRRMQQVLLNLLSNAVSYTAPGGEVRVSFEVCDGQRLRFLVADTGQGIAKRDFEQVFMPFVRLGDAEERPEGAGLGLAVSKSLVERMDGTIGIARSRLGAGTTFFVELPLVEAPADALEAVFGREREGAPDPAGLRGRILYVEDNAANVELIRATLQGAEVELLVAERGEAGLRLAAERSPDLILLDMQLPGMSGADVLSALKRGEATREIPVVVLSADPTAAHVNAALAAGAHRYLTKPLHLGRFVEAVAELLESEAGAHR